MNHIPVTPPLIHTLYILCVAKKRTEGAFDMKKKNTGRDKNAPKNCWRNPLGHPRGISTSNIIVHCVSCSYMQDESSGIKDEIYYQNFEKVCWILCSEIEGTNPSPISLDKISIVDHSYNNPCHHSTFNLVTSFVPMEWPPQHCVLKGSQP